MSFKYYKTNYGVFTILLDDTIYNYLVENGVGSITVAQNGSLTSEGETLYNLLNMDKWYITLMSSVTLPSIDASDNMRSFTPNFIINHLSDITTERTTKTIEISNSTITLNYRYEASIAYMIYNCILSNSAGSYSGIYGYPYGSITADTYHGSVADYFTFTPIIGNSAGDSFINALIHANDDQCLFSVYDSATFSDAAITFFINNTTPISEDEITSTDPYKEGGSSDTGGGDGTFTGDNDPVDIPSLPTVGAQDAGFISLFAPTITQLKNLASFMWSDLFDIDTFKKIFNDPMDSILGLSVVPVDVPTSGAREITVGNIVTTVSMNVASQQYIEVDCGSVDFTSKYFGSYLDYEPYTKISIYVPYSGYHDLRTDDIMGRVVRMVYHIDILTGSLVAFLKCGDSVLYEFNGACASNIPVTNISYNSTIENAMRIAVNIGTTVATAGASAPLSASGAINMVGSTAEGALSMKPSVGRSGSMGGTTGIMGNQIPYFIVTRPRICVPTKQNHYQGYPSFVTYNIGALAGKGFTAFENILLKDLYLTDGEKSELESILKEGIYL